jgi:hypothetical protein
MVEREGLEPRPRRYELRGPPVAHWNQERSGAWISFRRFACCYCYAGLYPTAHKLAQ